MKNKKKLIVISLNELNFDVIDHYIKKYNLKNLEEIKRNLSYTHSEKEYKFLEPWIQWISFYYGLTSSEHNVFRLGEKIKTDDQNIFEIIEKKGFKVGLLSNEYFVSQNPDFYSRWTETISVMIFGRNIIKIYFCNGKR